jgi:hypothetical protein
VLIADILEAMPDTDDPCLEVHIIPAEPEYFPGTKAKHAANRHPCFPPGVEAI